MLSVFDFDKCFVDYFGGKFYLGYYEFCKIFSVFFEVCMIG